MIYDLVFHFFVIRSRKFHYNKEDIKERCTFYDRYQTHSAAFAKHGVSEHTMHGVKVTEKHCKVEERVSNDTWLQVIDK